MCMGMHGEVYMCMHVEGKCSPQLLFLRQPGLIIGLELIDYARLADQAAPGTHLSLSPKFWAGRFKWFFLCGLRSELRSLSLYYMGFDY